MSQQTQLLFEPPPTEQLSRDLAEEGMDAALHHAEECFPQWGEIAYGFLARFCAMRTDPFISEDVSEASKAPGGIPQPPSDRAWGSIYRRAVRAGLIVRDGTGISARRHGSICPRWRAA